MTYKEALRSAMGGLAKDEKVRFVGYGLKHGRAAGSMADAKEEQIIEMPVAENLMTGFAIGLALKGLRPVVYYERFDFVLNAADAIVNHLNAARIISRGEYNPTCILRVVVGNKAKPLFTGHTHTQDFTEAFKRMVDFPVLKVTTPEQVTSAYRFAHDEIESHSTMIVELKDLI